MPLYHLSYTTRHRFGVWISTNHQLRNMALWESYWSNTIYGETAGKWDCELIVLDSGRRYEFQECHYNSDSTDTYPNPSQ